MNKINFKISDHISWQRVYDTVFIFDEIRHEVMALDEITTKFWCYLESGYSIDKIAFMIAGEYDVAFDKVKYDVAEFITLLSKNNIIFK